MRSLQPNSLCIPGNPLKFLVRQSRAALPCLLAPQANQVELRTQSKGSSLTAEQNPGPHTEQFPLNKATIQLLLHHTTFPHSAGMQGHVLHGSSEMGCKSKKKNSQSFTVIYLTGLITVI